MHFGQSHHLSVLKGRVAHAVLALAEQGFWQGP
jgi:hypothetical protein